MLGTAMLMKYDTHVDGMHSVKNVVTSDSSPLPHNTSEIDLTDSKSVSTPQHEQLERYISETLAAHTAVVLAKTQAAAARAEANYLSNQMKSLHRQLETETIHKQDTTQRLSASQEKNYKLDKELAIEKTRLSEVIKQNDYVLRERTNLAHKVSELEKERNILWSSMGWWSRLKAKNKFTNDTQRP